jgi:hypothetical protein
MQSSAKYTLTPEQCLQFARTQTVNPLTLKKIKPYGYIHKQLMKSCNIKNITIQIIGLGCSSVKQNVLERYETYLGNELGMPCVVYCNQSMMKTLYDVTKTCINFIPSKKHKFVQYVLNEVKQYINKGYNVFLLGYSYGGSVASRIAEILHKDPQGLTYVNRLNIITLGSIYVPRPDRTQGVNISHYMFENDVALKCNKLGKKGIKEPYVVWLQQSDYLVSSKKKKSIFGTKEEWEAHTSYNFARQLIFNDTLPVKIVI